MRKKIISCEALNAHSISKCTSLIVATFFGLTASILHAGELTPPDFIATVTKVNQHGMVYFENNGARRLWGVVPDVDYLRELIVGEVLACHEAGKLRGKEQGIGIITHVAVCESASIKGNPKFPEGLIDHILKHGRAHELCSESRGMFGTCPQRN